jgi:RNA polymerase sigma-70 factor (ECF subfamily)
MASPEPPRDDDEATWAPRIRAGDVRAFEALFRAYHARLVTFVEGYLHSREAAEEVVQDVFLKIWNGREGWEVRGSVRGYLYASARNTALNTARRRRLETRGLERLGAGPGGVVAPLPERGALERLESEETAAQVRRAIDHLPERSRQVVRLRWEHGLRYAEIAEIMGISVKGVENQLSRAMKTLRASLSRLVS